MVKRVRIKLSEQAVAVVVEQRDVNAVLRAAADELAVRPDVADPMLLRHVWSWVLVSKDASVDEHVDEIPPGMTESAAATTAVRMEITATAFIVGLG